MKPDAIELYEVLRDAGYTHKQAFNVVLAYLEWGVRYVRAERGEVQPTPQRGGHP